MSASFGKKLAELDAYLQMLIVENESIDRKLDNLSISSISLEREGLLNIKNNLETLLGSIKHSIVLLQIAKVSLKTSNSDTEDSTPPARPARHSKSASSTPNSKDQEHKKRQRQSPLLSGPQPTDVILNAEAAHHRSKLSTSTTTTTDASVAGSATAAATNTAAVAVSAAAAASAETADRGLGCSSGKSVNVSHQASAVNPRRDEDDVAYEEDDDDDAFFDADDEQHNRSTISANNNSISNPARGDKNSSIAEEDEKEGSQVRDTGGSNIIRSSVRDYSNLLEDSITSKLVIDKQENSETLTSNTMPPNSETNNNNTSNNNIINDNDASNEVSIDWDALYDDEDEEDLGSLESQGSVIKHLLSQIRIGMDLTKVVLPTFILERRSLLEMYADFFAHPDLFSAIPDYKTAEERMVQVVRWYLSAFHAGRKSSVAKKPYNPILGEIFRCQWQLDETKKTQTNNIKESTTGQQKLTFIAEQVSHHPPVSAFYAQNKDKAISCCAHIYTKSKYLGLSVGVHNVGQGIINLHNHKETYVCTFPSAFGRSILTVPWVELGGQVSIVCNETGFKANIEFVTKPFYGGKKHRVMGEILRPNNEPFLNIDGEWNGVMHYKEPPNNSDKQIFVDTTSLPVIKKKVEPVSVQESFESRNVWKEVTRALKLQDITTATAAKSFIEQRQRDLLRDRTEKGAKWKTRYFSACDDGWIYSQSD